MNHPWTSEEYQTLYNLKDNWVMALRSGVYEQGAGALKKMLDTENGAYCCLGVLINVIDPNILDQKDNPPGYSILPPRTHPLWSNQGSYITGNLVSFTIQKVLASLNDDGIDFKSISNVISRMELPELFTKYAPRVLGSCNPQN